MMTYPEWKSRNRDRLIALVAVAVLGLVLLFTGCAGDQMLDGNTDDVFRKITKHDAITLSDKTTIYGSAEPPSPCLVAHEESHKRQVRILCNFLVSAGYIDDDDTREIACGAVWVSVYTLDFAVHGAKNRFELGAREESAKECGR